MLGLNDAYIVVHRSHHGVEVDVGRKKRRVCHPGARSLVVIHCVLSCQN